MIKDKYIDLVKSRVDICQLAVDLHPETSLKAAGTHRKKCCCYFHSEKTPSLMLDSTTNRYKCFGCGKGGDIISFVEESNGLDFNGAICYLLKMYCPDVDIPSIYEKKGPDEIALQKQKDSFYAYNEYAYEFFREQYQADTPEAFACRQYAEADKGGRWDAAYCQTVGLGYSPLKGNQFLSFALSKGLKTDILLQLGLIAENEKRPGEYYDFYRGRLMIPQRDRYGRIVTFTARSLDPQSSCKYLNGKDCLIYKKSQSVFGIDVALKAARQAGKVYLVEGAPDVMRLQSIGIGNAIASLGGAWSTSQLNEFSKFGCNICFIPDNDIPKDGAKFGAGDQSVFRNAKTALEMGFNVSVRELPTDGHKQDPDSYLTDLSKWEVLEEKDFILWYAEKNFGKNPSNEEKVNIINDVCSLLVLVQSDVQQTSILTELKEKYKKAPVWKAALADAARKRQEFRRQQALKKDDELKGFHFFRKGYHYYDIDAQGREHDWTNFIIRPLFLIADDKKPTRIFELENENRVKKTIELQQADVTKLDRFKEKIEGKGNFLFFERQDKYELFKAYIYEKTEEAQRVTQMGWNNLGEKGFYAFCNGIIYEGKWKPIDEYGIIRLENENFYLPAMSKFHKTNKTAFVNERRFIHDPKMDIAPELYFNMLQELYGDNGVVAFCFYIATLFRDIITDSTRSFPILNIYGKKGTGKTEFALFLMALFQNNPEVSNLESTTYYAMGEKCAEVSNMLVHFDEYKNSLSNKHIDFLKGVYDNAGRSKRSSDGEHREATRINCGVLITGQEMPTADIALFSRVIFLESQKSERTKEETDKYQKFLKLRNMCPTNITIGLMRYRENFNAGWYDAWKRSLAEIKSEVDYNVIGERFINNWAMMLASYYCLKSFVNDLPFTEQQVHDICIEGLTYQHSLCSSTDEIAVFWSMFSKARQLGEIREGQDYKISQVNNLKVSTKSDPQKAYKFDEPTYILFVREKICIAKANIQAKREGKGMIPDESLLSYLVSIPDYLGKTKSPLKFYILDENGNPTKRHKENGESELVYDQERVLAFDYSSIAKNYDLNLQLLTEKMK